jgi:hypothetical protein
MVCDVEGRVGDDVRLENAASKGRSGLPVPICKQLQKALVELHDEAKPNIGRPRDRQQQWPRVNSEQRHRVIPPAVQRSGLPWRVESQW